MENEDKNLKLDSIWLHEESNYKVRIMSINWTNRTLRLYILDSSSSFETGIKSFLTNFINVEEAPAKIAKEFVDKITEPLTDEIEVGSVWVSKTTDHTLEITVKHGTNLKGIINADLSWAGTVTELLENYIPFIKPSPDRINAIPKDNVNSPDHYTTGNIEVIDFLEDQKLGFHEATIVQYVVRAPHKNGLEDLQKAKWYLDRLVKLKEKETKNGK